MQIHYLWIRQSRYLDEASINLSSRFIFEMSPPEKGNNDGTRNLTITLNPDYIPNFFEHKEISNVTAIIGKNGAGKSSILKYIRTHLPDGINSDFRDDIIAYSVKEEDGDDSLYLLYPETLKLSIVDKTRLFKIREFGEQDSQLDGIPLADYIHYSYFLEYNEDITNWSGLINISTTALLTKARTRIIEENLNNSEIQAQLLTKTSDFENLYLDEVARAIQFLGSDDSKKLPFKRPNELTVDINLEDGIYFEKNSDHKDISELLNTIYTRNKWDTRAEGFINNLLLAIFINFQVDQKKYSSNNPTNYSLEIESDESTREYILRFFSEMRKYRIKIEGKLIEVARFKFLSHIVPEFIGFMEKLLKRKDVEVTSGQATRINVPLEDDTEALFQELRDYYLKVKGISTFFNFRWRSLSTGEQSYLSFMSRFHHIKYHEHNNDSLNKNLVIMIDEGDACYHPEWQRKFFNISLGYLTRLFKGHSIQLIFTANTPFLSSDLPKSNVLFIEKKKDKSSEFHSKNNSRDQTFAANIHTLYSDSFYMDGILIGEFAKEKLDKIIGYLNNEKETKRNETYKKIIDMIGEPVLRKKLQGMWSDKFGLNEERIRLQQRLDEINKIMGDNNPDIEND